MADSSEAVSTLIEYFVEENNKQKRFALGVASINRQDVKVLIAGIYIHNLTMMGEYQTK